MGLNAEPEDMVGALPKRRGGAERSPRAGPRACPSRFRESKPRIVESHALLHHWPAQSLGLAAPRWPRSPKTY